MKTQTSIYKVERFCSYLWKIKAGRTTVGYISIGSYKQYYVRLKTPPVVVVEGATNVRMTLQIFTGKYPIPNLWFDATGDFFGTET